MASPNRLLSVAAASGRIAYVLFVGREPKDWGLSKRASKSPNLAARFMKRWIAATQPDAVVTETVSATLKGDGTQQLIEAIQQAAAESKILDMSVVRRWRFANKYAEAAILRARYPDLADKLPIERIFYDAEPRNTVFIDAIVLAEEVFGQEVADQG